jgi:hypothetical protein
MNEKQTALVMAYMYAKCNWWNDALAQCPPEYVIVPKQENTSALAIAIYDAMDQETKAAVTTAQHTHITWWQNNPSK